MGRTNILLTSVGRRSYLVKYFKEALGAKGEVHAANSSDVSPAFLVADKSIVSPMIYDAAYIDFLLDYCKENEIKAIVSLFDVDLPILAANKQLFLNIGTRVIVSDPDVIEICNDKWHTYQFLVENGFDAPATYIDLNEAKHAIAEGALSYPVIVKPRWGMGSIGVFEADNEEELMCFHKKVKTVIQKSYLRFESEQDFEKCVLIQEKVLGQEHGLDVMNDLDGNFIQASVKMKCAMRSGETDCAVTVRNNDLYGIGCKLSGILKHIGNLDVDVIVTEDRNCVLELNARFGGGYPFSHVAGVNLPKAIVGWLQGEKVPENIFVPEVGVMAQKDINMVVLKKENQ